MAEHPLVEKVARAIATVESQGGWTAEVMDKLWDSYDMQAEFAIKAVFDAIAKPTEPMMAALKATRALYYISRIHNGKSNVPLSVFRFADDEPVWGPGNLDDAQKWIDAECYRAMIAVLRKEVGGD